MRAREVLGLSDEEAEQLFLVDEWPPRLEHRYRPEPVTWTDYQANARTAMARIELFITSGAAW
jgi:hypothetical protein